MTRKNFKSVCAAGFAALLIAGFATVFVSCTGKDKKQEQHVITKEDVIGTWSASAGKFNLSMEITESGYRFSISEPGNGGMSYKGTYSLSGVNKISFLNDDNSALAAGEVSDEQLSLTFVHALAVIMIGTEAANNTVFMRDNETYTVSGSLEYSETATWSDVSAIFDSEGKDIATTSIANKRFSLVMPEPKAGSLRPCNEYISQSGITLNPANAKCVIASFFARKGSQSAEIAHVGINSSKNIVSMISYIYADRNVNVSGTYTFSGGKEVYNLQLKKGWNSVINTWDYSSAENDFYNTGAVPSNSTWITESDISGASATANRTYADGVKQSVFRANEIKKEKYRNMKITD